MKKILYIDMDNVLVDFSTGIAALSDELKEAYKGNYDETPGIFSLMQPMKGAVEAVNALADTMIFMCFLQHLGVILLLGAINCNGYRNTLGKKKIAPCISD